MDHKNLDVWKQSIELTINIYNISNAFPKHELFGLTAQIRRAAVSVSSNIAEGCGRETDKELLRFLIIARGSLAEVETQITISDRLGLLPESESVHMKIQQVGRLLGGLIKYLRNKVKKPVI